MTQTGTAGGTYSSTAGLTINAATGAITPSTSTAGTYTVTYTMAAGGGCAAQTATTSVTITTLPAATISYAGHLSVLLSLLRRLSPRPELLEELILLLPA